MYLRHFGLREAPFELTPNPRFLYFTARHREALANLKYGLSSAKAVTVLVGEAGTGKTTLIRAVLDSDACRQVRCVHLTNPSLTRNEFLETLARGFNLSDAAQTSKATLLSELDVQLRERRREGEITALIVDEAQRLNDELLEEVRLLSNIETDSEKLLPLVLAGQPELADRLNEVGQRQLKQRVALRCEISALSLGETAAYIAYRIAAAGSVARDLFTREAVILIHDAAHGIPRTISALCDNALLSAFALGRHTVDSAIVTELIRDFDLTTATRRTPVVLPPVPTRADSSSTSSTERTPAVEEPAESPDEQNLREPAKRWRLFGTSRR